jgi:hypothetical protein
VNSDTFNRHLERGRQQAEEHLGRIADGYRIALQTAGSKAAERFARLATAHLTADATNPGWTPPENQELVDAAELQRDARKRTAAAQKAALRAVVGSALGEVGISFDLANPLAAGLLDGLGVRAQDLEEAVRDQIATAILHGYQQGLSVADTAKAIKQAAWDIATPRAMMLARTHLNGIANGGSILAARLVNNTAGADEPPVGYKQWLATEDERTRETHADADGQIVPIDQPFQVGSEQADYPGDPDLSDEEAANCRCTVVFVDNGGGADVEAEMPLAASGSEPTNDVALDGTVSESLEDTTIAASDLAELEASTAAVTVTVDDAAAPAAADGSPVAWRALLCVEGEPSQDGPSLVRMLKPGGGTWRTLPLPLGVMYDTPHSDGADAVVCGRIDQIWRDTVNPNEIWGAGVFNPDEIGMRAAEMVGNLSLRGVSIDPYVATLEIIEPPLEDDSAGTIGVQPTLMTFAEYVIGGATICAFQALERATISLVENDDGSVESAHVATASCFVLTRTAGPIVAASTVSELQELTETVLALKAAVDHEFEERRRMRAALNV